MYSMCPVIQCNMWFKYSTQGFVLTFSMLCKSKIVLLQTVHIHVLATVKIKHHGALHLLQLSRNTADSLFCLVQSALANNSLKGFLVIVFILLSGVLIGRAFWPADVPACLPRSHEEGRLDCEHTDQTEDQGPSSRTHAFQRDGGETKMGTVMSVHVKQLWCACYGACKVLVLSNVELVGSLLLLVMA